MDLIMENQYLKVTVTTWGGQLKSVLRKCDGVEHMWNADPQVWGYHAPILFPYCGAVKDNVITIHGKTYPGPMHGFAQPMEHRVLAHGPGFVKLEITDTPETLAQWPFRFRLVTTYTLKGDGVCHSVAIENRNSEEMAFGFGFHPGFAVPFDSKHTSDDYEIRFSELESPTCIGFPRGLKVDSTYSLGTNIRSLPVDAKLFRGPSHCMVNLASRFISLREKDTGRRVTVEIGGFPYTLVWTAGGGPKFLCIEPWHSIPSPEAGSTEWSEKPAAAILAPGETWSTALNIRFER